MSVAELLAPPQLTTQYNAAGEYVWIDCTLPRHEEVKIEVRVDLTNGERRRLQERHNEIVAQFAVIDGRVKKKNAELKARHKEAWDAGDAQGADAIVSEIVALAEEHREATEINRRRQYELIAPFIRRWNIADPEKPEPAPPPQIAGADAFDTVTDFFGSWVFMALMQAYQKNGFWSVAMVSSLSESDAPAEPQPKSDTTTPEPKPAGNISDLTQASPKRLPGRSRSGSKT